MKLSQFRQLVDEEFGPSFAAVILADTRLTDKSDQTPLELIKSGDDPKEVWLAPGDRHSVAEH